ncbi:MAG: adenylate/guanylate cyclase domain-containing protein [Methyloceanibacter sp.]|nr:adenylate/guanylate cyclase domain-containing protein [Methyloceanibacter sp.]
MQFRPRGPVKVKGIGQIETWLLKEERRVSSD